MLALLLLALGVAFVVVMFAIMGKVIAGGASAPNGAETASGSQEDGEWRPIVINAIRLSDENLRDVYEKLPQAFRGIRPTKQADIDSRAMIFESAYNQVAASRDKAFAARVLADAMAALEENAAVGGWKIPDRLLPIAEDCRRARAG